MEYELIGTIVPAVKCILKPGEAMYTQSGGMMMYTGDINYSTGLRGGVVKSVARQLLARESAFYDNVLCRKAYGNCYIFYDNPWNDSVLEIRKGSSMICQRRHFFVQKSRLWQMLFLQKDYVLVFQWRRLCITENLW